MLTEKIIRFLNKKEFINIGTCDFEGRPNVAPKFVLSVNEDSIILADYVIGQTYQNLKINTRASVSTVDIDSLSGYQFNGPVEIIDKGSEYEKLKKLFSDKQIKFSVGRVINSIRRHKENAVSEVGFPEKIVVLKFKVEEVVEITSKGELKRKNIQEEA